MERAPAQRGHLTNKPRLQANWWRFEAPALRLRSAKRNLHRTLAIAVVSKTVMPVRVNADDVYSQDAVVFATDLFAQQAVVSSSPPPDVGDQVRLGHANRSALHAVRRVRRRSASRRLRCAARDRPHLDEERREIMLRRDLGLTKLYNLVNDPSLPDVRPGRGPGCAQSTSNWMRR